MGTLAKSVHPVHFEDFSGRQFERIVFAYHLGAGEWNSLDWYGQSGSDSGRDIWGVRESGESLCVQCVNRKAFSLDKALWDLDKISKGPHGTPDSFLMVSGSPVSATARDRIKTHAAKCGIARCDIW